MKVQIRVLNVKYNKVIKLNFNVTGISYEQYKWQVKIFLFGSQLTKKTTCLCVPWKYSYLLTYILNNFTV